MPEFGTGRSEGISQRTHFLQKDCSRNLTKNTNCIKKAGIKYPFNVKKDVNCTPSGVQGKLP